MTNTTIILSLLVAILICLGAYAYEVFVSRPKIFRGYISRSEQ